LVGPCGVVRRPRHNGGGTSTVARRIAAKRRAWDPVWCGALGEADGRGARPGVEPEFAGPTTQASEGGWRSRTSVRARTSVKVPVLPIPDRTQTMRFSGQMGHAPVGWPPAAIGRSGARVVIWHHPTPLTMRFIRVNRHSLRAGPSHPTNRWTMRFGKESRRQEFRERPRKGDDC